MEKYESLDMLNYLFKKYWKKQGGTNLYLVIFPNGVVRIMHLTVPEDIRLYEWYSIAEANSDLERIVNG